MLSMALLLAMQLDIGQSMYGVVLIVTQLDDGYASYGSGIVVDREGNVLTNLHVLDRARSVHALTYDPEKPSYAATDGGLSRLVFEREKELVPVRVVRGDPVLDLAVVRLEQPARVLPLALAQGAATIGEPVAALGHPEQNFWTITRGQVSGLHQGVIQHDAAVNKGNSGGPLLNARGEVIGINTSFLKGAHGISYARPASLATKLLSTVQAPLVLDRSTPQRALESCLHARELGDPSYSQCINWGTHYAAFRDGVLAALAGKPGPLMMLEADPQHPDQPRNARIPEQVLRGGPKSHARGVIRAWLESGDGRAEPWVKKYGPFMLAFMLSDDAAEHGRTADDYFFYAQDATRGGRPLPGERRVSPSRTMPRAQLVLDPGVTLNVDGGDVREVRVQRGTGLKVALADIGGLRKVMKMGLRVDEVRSVGADRAWAALAGRNLDGTPYRYSVMLIRASDGWRELDHPSAEDRKTAPLPARFPPHLSFTTLPAIVAMLLGTAPISVYLYEDQPQGSDNFDLDLEHRWPAYLESIKNKSTPGGAAAASTLEEALGR